jgi:hypothetical protein
MSVCSSWRCSRPKFPFQGSGLGGAWVSFPGPLLLMKPTVGFALPCLFVCVLTTHSHQLSALGVCVCVHACVCVPQSCPGSLPSYSHFLMPLSLHLFLPQFPQPYWSALSLPSNLCIIPLPVGIHQSHPCACKNTD